MEEEETMEGEGFDCFVFRTPVDVQEAYFAFEGHVTCFIIAATFCQKIEIICSFHLFKCFEQAQQLIINQLCFL